MIWITNAIQHGDFRNIRLESLLQHPQVDYFQQFKMRVKWVGNVSKSAYLMPTEGIWQQYIYEKKKIREFHKLCYSSCFSRLLNKMHSFVYKYTHNYDSTSFGGSITWSKRINPISNHKELPLVFMTCSVYGCLTRNNEKYTLQKSLHLSDNAKYFKSCATCLEPTVHTGRGKSVTFFKLFFVVVVVCLFVKCLSICKYTVSHRNHTIICLRAYFTLARHKYNQVQPTNEHPKAVDSMLVAWHYKQ